LSKKTGAGFFEESGDPMSKKPNLTIVAPDTTIPAPPFELGSSGLSLWQRVQSEYAIGDAGGLELLAQICAAADTAAALTAEVERDGPVIRTARGSKPNPCLRDLLNHRAFITRTMTKLGISMEPIKPMGRPSMPTAWVPPQED
jgi:hypothetical protein